MSQAPTITVMLNELRQLVQRAQHLRWRERHSQRRRRHFVVSSTEKDVRQWCSYLRALIYRAHSVQQAQLAAVNSVVS